MNFKILEPSDYQILKPYFYKQPYKLAGYSLPSLIAWQKPQPYYAIADDTVIICTLSEKCPGDNHLILPVSTNAEYSPQKLSDLARKTNISDYWFVSDDYLTRYAMDEINSLFHCVEQPLFEDYVYLASDLAELRGNRYSKKRNLIHQFLRTYVDAGRVSTETITAQNASECLDFLEKWCSEYLCDIAPDYDFICEKQAVTNMVKNIDCYDVKSLVIRIDGIINAFGVCTHLNEEIATLNFEKAYSNIKGLYQYLDRECAAQLFKQYKYINKESDMGLPGLAQAKQSYHPVARVKSYRLTLI